jgi:electron transport complex protein RnfG
MFRSVGVLVVAGLVMATLLTLVRFWTAPHAQTAEWLYLHQQLSTLIEEPYVVLPLPEQPFLTPGRPAYRNSNGSVTVLPVRAPDGYSGPIDMLAAFGADGRLRGVRIVAHRETPGLGDKLTDPAWLESVHGQLPLALKKDGGGIDAFTGATITPRATLKAINAAGDWLARQPR